MREGFLIGTNKKILVNNKFKFLIRMINAILGIYKSETHFKLKGI